MSKTLDKIAEDLIDADKKVQLIYAFNGTGKTRLSRTLKRLIRPQILDEIDNVDTDNEAPRVIYYNAFTEDLFYWDNDLDGDLTRKLKIQPNAYTRWTLQEQGQDQNAIGHFQKYTSERLNPRFNEEYKTEDSNGKQITIPAFSEVTFSYKRGDDEATEHIKISKGEESIFIWSIFYSLLEQIIAVLNIAEQEDRETDRYDFLEYIFIDDPVSSLDENHLIELAVNLASIIKSAPNDLKFILTTHSPLFYNVLCNELRSDDKRFGYKSKTFEKYRLDKKEDNSFSLEKQSNDSPFSYHLFLMGELKNAIQNGEIKKYHFHFLRHVLEKTSTFLGYKRWEHLLPTTDDGSPDAYASRILNLSSHSKHSGEEVALISDDDKRVLTYLVKYINEEYNYWDSQGNSNAATN